MLNRFLSYVGWSMFWNLSLSRSSFYHAELTTGLSGKPAFSPAATCRIERHLQSCWEIPWPRVKTAQQVLVHCTHIYTQASGGEVGVFSFFCCLWWCSLAEASPRAMGNAKENSDNRHRKWTRMPLDDTISYGCTTELDNICKLEAMAVRGNVEKLEMLAWHATTCMCWG